MLLVRIYPGIDHASVGVLRLAAVYLLIFQKPANTVAYYSVNPDHRCFFWMAAYDR